MAEEKFILSFNEFIRSFHVYMRKLSRKDNQHYLDLGFHTPVTFRLVQGNGPVHLVGSHSVGKNFIIYLTLFIW